MSRLLRIARSFVLLGILCSTHGVIAQPTLISERKNVPRWTGAIISKSFELPGRRFVHCGDVEVRAPQGGRHELLLVVSTAVGDTVRYRHLNQHPVQVVSQGDYLLDAVLEPDHSLTVLSRCPVPNTNPAQPADPGYALTQVDTLGNVRWQQRFPIYPLSTVVAATALLRVPDGYLVLVNPVNTALSTPTALYTCGGVAKFDLQGNALWQRTWPSRGYGGVGYLNGLVARPDGSYLATGYSDNGTPYTGGAALPRFDYWLVQFTAQGDTLRTSRFGVSPQLEVGYHVYSTRDGGAAISGARRLPTNSNNDAQLVKVDSLLRPQWTYTQPNISNSSEYFAFVQPTRRGDVLFGGGRLNSTTRRIWVEFKTATASGVPRWTWQYDFNGNMQRQTGMAALVSSADSTAYITGPTWASSSSSLQEDYYARFANVGAPYIAPLCRTPPQATFGFVRSASGDTLRVVDLSTAGPRYAMLAIWHWEFGDGSTFDGPVPSPHHYAAAPGASTGVRLTVTNNLGCTSTQAVFPFALATAETRALAARAELFPNPAAGAATLVVPGLRAQPPVGLTVLNALGQVVLARAATVRQGRVREVLDLTGLPPSVYAIRLRTQEGTLVKRLIRE